MFVGLFLYLSLFPLTYSGGCFYIFERQIFEGKCVPAGPCPAEARLGYTNGLGLGIWFCAHLQHRLPSRPVPEPGKSLKYLSVSSPRLWSGSWK